MAFLMSNTFRIPCVCLVLLLSAGCGRNDVEVVAVEGQITFGGGPWPKPGAVYFTPLKPAEGLPNRPAWGKFDTDGHFSITSFRAGDGLVPGKYRVSVECLQGPASMGSTVSLVPLKYQSASTSDLEVTIEPKQSRAEVRLDVPKTGNSRNSPS